MPANPGSPLQGDHTCDLRERLASLIAELPEPYALVLGLIEIEKASPNEAAGFLGLGEASLRLLYAEGRRRLRDIVLKHTELGSL
ncbi:MAG: hypothetical protein ACR2MY_13275 [Candidatus Dormibacteria bacterium]